MVTSQREIEREEQRRRLEIEKEKGGISTSNMTTTQGAGLGGNMGEEGRQGRRRRRREKGASCGCYVHCGLYLFDPLLFKHRKKGERRRQKEIERYKRKTVRRRERERGGK